MIYLSRLALDLRSRQVQSELRNPYEMHRTLSRAFPEGEEEYKECRCLFRAEGGSEGPYAQVLVQSRHEPDWAALQEVRGYLGSSPEVKPFQPTLSEGQVLQFRLRANPTVKRNGKRVALRTPDEREAWLRRKGEAAGFVPLRIEINQEDPVTGATAAGSATTLNAVRYDGVLRVTDPALLVAAIEGGIGSAKGFGFGLLSVAPMRG